MESLLVAESPKAFTLSEFSRFVVKAMSREPSLMGAWIVAEISDLSLSGGHCYMNLIEKDPSGTTIARMRATIWASTFHRLRYEFQLNTGRDLANGMKVRLYGGVNYHPNYGLSFNVGAIDPSYTMGDLERIRREILLTLQREGIIDCNRKLQIDQPPRLVAVISSEKAAGYGDFINQLANNPAGVEFHTVLFPAIMQGDRTAQSVLHALDMVEQTSSIINWDCVVIIRGGGATTDMNGFDDLQLARRVATFRIPVVVGIGHERDRCVLDEIACVRCKTPTAVAAWLSDTASMAWQNAIDLCTRISAYASERLKGEQIRLQGLMTMIPVISETRIQNARLRLHTISALIPKAAGEATSKGRIRLESLTTTLRLASLTRIERELPRLDLITSSLKQAAFSMIDHEKTLLTNLEKMVEVLDPSSTLKRGYTITRINGKAVTDPSQAVSGVEMETLTSGGLITSTVSSPKHEKSH